MAIIIYNSNTKTINYECFNEIIIISCFLKTDCIYDKNLSFNINCILGILNTGNAEYLFFCTEHESAGTFDGVEYFRIVSVSYIAIENYDNIVNFEYAESVKDLIESLKFYYSFDEIEEHFCWNKEILKNFNKNSNIERKSKNFQNSEDNRSPFSTKNNVFNVSTKNIDNKLEGKMFCGYFETRKVKEDDKVFYLKIQSKISVKKIGTRMFSRGVDEQGKVSFFVETKFTIKNEDIKNEFIILRGSVPLYWSSVDPLKPHKINLDNTYEENEEAFKLHFENLKLGYENNICVVDLLGSKKDERKLSKFYSELCLKNSINYIHFDLNSHTKSFSHLKKALKEKLIKSIKKINATQGLNSQESFNIKINHSFIKKNTHVNEENENMWDNDLDFESHKDEEEEKHLIKNFKAIYRVNCMDCLDRTNICQYLLFNFSQDYKFKVIKTMWANNGDALSNMYTGSNALKSGFPKKGHISIIDKFGDFMISANRMINNKFTDKDKQQAINILLGKKFY